MKRCLVALFQVPVDRRHRFVKPPNGIDLDLVVVKRSAAVSAKADPEPPPVRK